MRVVLRALPPGIFSDDRDSGPDVHSGVLLPNFQIEKSLSSVNLKLTRPLATREEGGHIVRACMWDTLCWVVFHPQHRTGTVVVILLSFDKQFSQHSRLADGPSLTPTWPAPGFKYVFGWPRLWGHKDNFISNHCYMTAEVLLVLKCLVTTGFIFIPTISLQRN